MGVSGAHQRGACLHSELTKDLQKKEHSAKQQGEWEMGARGRSEYPGRRSRKRKVNPFVELKAVQQVLSTEGDRKVSVDLATFHPKAKRELSQGLEWRGDMREFVVPKDHSSGRA